MMFMPFDLSQINGELLVVDTTLVLLAVGIATAVGLAAGFYPSWRAAAKLEPVTALKTD
jgi:ABC-type antimicrobial peptide transport system permease subunit